MSDALYFRCLDFETTGFPPDAGIVEIGATDVKLNPDESVEVGRPRSWLTNPARPIEVGAMGIHHITEDDLKDAPHPEAILSDLDKGIDFFVAHNAKFEQEFFSTPIPWICTYKLALRFCPKSPNHQNQTLRYFLKTPVDRQTAFPPHRAGPDSYVTAHTLAKFLKDFGSRLKPELMVQWSAQPPLMPTCPIGSQWKGKPWSEVEIGFLMWCLRQPTMEADIKWNVQKEVDRRNGKQS